MTVYLGGNKMILWNRTNLKYMNVQSVKVFEHEFNYVGLLGNDLLNKGV